mmetsp:Transcript_13421/g.26753  ORF Transcript_13421/g.26753 Transcript_13421/m.26753 type:complete len:588 (+) Transcript_13421:217-1980(+)
MQTQGGTKTPPAESPEHRDADGIPFENHEITAANDKLEEAMQRAAEAALNGSEVPSAATQGTEQIQESQGGGVESFTDWMQQSGSLPSLDGLHRQSRYSSGRRSIRKSIEVTRPSMNRTSMYEEMGPATIIRDADGQEFLIQPVRESLDIQVSTQYSGSSQQYRSLSKGRAAAAAALAPVANRLDDLDDFESPFANSTGLEAALDQMALPSDETRETAMTALTGRLSGSDESRYPSSSSAGTVGQMYLHSIRSSCPVNVEYRETLFDQSKWTHPSKRKDTLSSSAGLSGGLEPRKNRVSNSSQLQDNESSEVDSWEICMGELDFGKRVGIGAYGEVFQGLYKHTDVAIKVLLEQDLPDKIIQNFKKEVFILKKLRHPNIVQFMGACTQPSSLCIVSEYMTKGSLFKILHSNNEKERVNLTLGQKLKMACDVAVGMHYLHTSSPPIIHGDLKSPNLLLDANYTVKVCDFGLSRIKTATKLSVGSKMGTPEWTAPEVLQSSTSSEASDVYSFGVVLWEIFTGQVPWEDVNAMQVVLLVGFHNKQLEIPTNIPQAIQDLIHECFGPADERPSFADIIPRLRQEIHRQRST